jgi:hypothetical protein
MKKTQPNAQYGGKNLFKIGEKKPAHNFKHVQCESKVHSECKWLLYQ